MNANDNNAASCKGCIYFCAEGIEAGFCDKFRDFSTWRGPRIQAPLGVLCKETKHYAPPREISPHEYELYCLDALPEDEEGNRVLPTVKAVGAK